MIISNLINFVEEHTYIPAVAIGGVGMASNFITNISVIFGTITIITAGLAGILTVIIKVCELVRKIKKWNKENVDDKK